MSDQEFRDLIRQALLFIVECKRETLACVAHAAREVAGRTVFPTDESRAFEAFAEQLDLVITRSLAASKGETES